jgi:hypothetical protein
MLPLKNLDHGIKRLTLISFILVLAVHFGGRDLLQSRYNLKDMAQKAGEYEAQEFSLAHFAKYEGQFGFLGRLKNPLDVVHADSAVQWAKQHPEGKLITYCRNIPSITGHSPDFTQWFAVESLTLWDSRPSVPTRTSPTGAADAGFPCF